MALTSADLQTLRAFFRTPEGQLHVAMLKKKLVELDEKLRTASGEDLLRKQGRAQQLDELIRELSTAGEALKRQDLSGSYPRVWNQG